MSHGIADDVAAYIDAHIADLTLATNLFSGRYPDKPDDCVTVFARPGAPPLTTLTGHGALPEMKTDQPMIQIRVRTMTYGPGQAWADAIFGLLQGITETVLDSGGGVVHLIDAMQSPAHLGIDEKQRHEWSQNFHVLWENPNR